ncbi:MAG: Fe2+-dependent dioxygenase [Casimicrobiaceae bacterium]|nr:Fe2+-dependent dioxygenase [Pseudomonadota bacterium]
MLHLPKVLTTETLAALRSMAARATWIDGRATAGGAAAQLKRNEQVDERSDDGNVIAETVLKALQRHALFEAAAFPARVTRPLMNRYAPGMEYAPHVDNPLMGGSNPLRTDLSGTLFLSDPGDYDGGELVVDSLAGRQGVKLPAGDLFLYPATRVHYVAPVTRGVRLGAIFWIQSLVGDTEKRSLLFEMSRALQALEQQHGPSPEITQLAGCYARLVHRWAQP